MALSTLDPAQHQALGAELWLAETSCLPVGPLTARFPDLDQDDSYAVQAAVAALRNAQGARLVGKKIGLTSRAMQEMLGVLEPDFGRLYDVMEVSDGGEIDLGTLIAPMVEPEIGIVLKSRLEGPHVSTRQVLAAIDYVSPALEIVDSRIADWKIAWHDTVADNGSSARFVLADRAFSPLGLDLSDISVELSKNGRPEAAGSMHAVLGSPLKAVAWLVAKLSTYGLALEAGDLVLPGSPCRAIRAEKQDHFSANFGPLGAVSVRFTT